MACQERQKTEERLQSQELNHDQSYTYQIGLILGEKLSDSLYFLKPENRFVRKIKS